MVGVGFEIKLNLKFLIFSKAKLTNFLKTRTYDV